MTDPDTRAALAPAPGLLAASRRPNLAAAVETALRVYYWSADRPDLTWPEPPDELLECLEHALRLLPEQAAHLEWSLERAAAWEVPEEARAPFLRATEAVLEAYYRVIAWSVERTPWLATVALDRCERADAATTALADTDEADWVAAALRKLQRETWADPSGETLEARVRELGLRGDEPEIGNALYHVFTREPRGERPAWEAELRRRGYEHLVDRYLPFAVRAEAHRQAHPAKEAPGASTDAAADEHRGASRPEQEALETVELLAALEATQLGEREAAVLSADLEGQDAVQIAEALGITRGAVDTALSRARRKIRQTLDAAM